MSAKVSNMKRNVGRAARLSPHPNDEALLWRQKHKLLQVQEKGGPAVQRRSALQPWNSQQLQHWAKEPRAAWQEALGQHVRRLERLYLAHLLGVRGGWAKTCAPDSEGPAWRGATWWPRAWEKRRAAVRAEKSRKEDLVRLQPWHTKSRRTLVGVERKGATSQGVGLPRPPPGPREKNKGKRGPSRKTDSGRCPADPRVSRGLDAGKLWGAAGGITLLGARETDVTQGGRRQPGRTVHLVPGLKNNCRGQSPKGQVDSLEQLWPVGSTCQGGASPQASPCQRRKSKWQRELELAFEQLFNTNRKLRRHLSLHLESRPGMDANPREEQGFSEVPGRRGGTWREKTTADAEMEVVPARGATSPAEADARHTPPGTDLQKLLSRLENQNYRRMVEPEFQGERSLPSPEAGTGVHEESPLRCSAESRHKLPRLGALSRQCHPQEQAGRASSAASRQKQNVEQRRRTQLALLEHPEGSWEACGQTERGDETGEQTSACSAHIKASSSRDQEREGGCECSPSPTPAASSTDDDDSGHSQMIRDLQQQILEQDKLHKRFLEEARKRLREFQRLC